MPRGPISPWGMARLGTPPRETLTCRIEPLSIQKPLPVVAARKRPAAGYKLDVVVEREFVRVRAEADRVGFALSLVSDEGFDQLFAEYVALQHEGMIVFE